MATPGEYLVYQTVEDCTSLVQELERTQRLVWRIVERMEAIGAGPLTGFVWPNGYTQAKFVALYNALAALPDFVVDDAVRDDIFELLAALQ